MSTYTQIRKRNGRRPRHLEQRGGFTHRDVAETFLTLAFLGLCAWAGFSGLWGLLP
jgi:hypothetical protein